jgi:hypothetical protein
VGFSYASKDDNLVDTEDEVGEDLYQFLQVRLGGWLALL